MAVWRESTIEVFHAEGGSTRCACEVSIDDGRISLSYQDGGWVTYSGPELEPGHFELIAPEVNGKASLHRFNNARRLDGFWIENGERGMWRISLGEMGD